MSPARRPKNPTWLFDDPAKPLFTDSTFSVALKLLSPRGREIFSPQHKKFTSPGASWNSKLETASSGTVGAMLTLLFSTHLETSDEDPNIELPVSLFQDVALSNLPASQELLVVMEKALGEPERDIKALGSISIRSLLACGATWRDVFELLHLATWLVDADRSIEISIPRDDCVAWTKGIVRNLVYRLSLNPLAEGALLRRLEFGLEPITLDEAGRGLGVTRERFRQISRKFWEFADQCPLAPSGDLTNIVDLPVNEVAKLLPPWTALGRRNLMRLSGLWAGELPHEDALLGICEQATRDPRSAQLAKALVGPSGFLNIDQLKLKLEAINPEFSACWKTVLTKAFRVVALSGKWALISKKGPSQAEHAVRNQLSLGLPLTVGEIYEGLRRRAQGRGYSLGIPKLQSFKEILPQLECVTESDSRYSLTTEQAPRSAANTHIGWVIRRLLESDDGCASLDELILEGLNFGYNPNTTGLYATGQEELRTAKNIVWVVGRKPTAEILEAVQKRAEVLKVDTSLDIFDGGNEIVTLALQVGTVFVRSGQLTVPTPIGRVINVRLQTLVCICGAQADSPLRVDEKNNALRGGSWLQTHILLKHWLPDKLQLGSRVHLELSDGIAKLRLPGPSQGW